MTEIADRQKILTHFGKTEKELAEDVELIKKWLATQRHLPEIPHDTMIELFIINNKFRLEMVKQRLDMYYTIKTKIPSIYDILNPKTTQMQSCFDTLYTFNLPKLLDNVYQVSIFKAKDYVPNDFNINWWIAASLVHIAEVRFHENCILGAIIIFDQQHLKWEHITKTTPVHVKNTATIIEKVLSNRIKEFHFINYPPFMDVALKLCKPFVKPKLINRIRFHQSTKSLTEYIPLEMLPKDYGGNEKSIDELHGDWKEKLNKYQDRFDKLDKMKVNESLRSTPLKDTEIFGIQGTFKKLNVD